MTLKKNSPAQTGWVSHKDGYEYTKSEHIIQKTISWLREKHIFITLLYQGYQSGSTFVFDYIDQKLHIDKPKDWRSTNKNIRVVFRNASNIWSHFTGKILSESANTIILTPPRELFMLQRRSHFRVSLPDDCKATFMYNKKKCKLNMLDLSAGGMLLSGSHREDNPEQGHSIHDITITIPPTPSPSGKAEETIRFKVKKGEIVRSFTNTNTHQLCLRVHFIPTGPEEERIMKFVRQRELTILRKGLQD